MIFAYSDMTPCPGSTFQIPGDDAIYEVIAVTKTHFIAKPYDPLHVKVDLDHLENAVDEWAR